jgi:succinate dehydrogenase/fumarate reductase cytochrome b subunit (b558 family)
MSAAGSRAPFVLRRAHSLAGVVPLGIFLAEHLLTNATALWGRASFDRAVDRIQRAPGLVWLEALGIALPLSFHALYGIAIARNARPNVGRYPYGANWLFVLQRVTGVLAFAFVLAHLWHFRVAKARGTLDVSQFYAEIDRTFAQPAMFALYLAGLTAVVFHFANGLRTACETWGISSTDRARKTAAIAALVVGLSLWGLGVDTMYHFALRCGGVIPLPGLDRLAVCGV